jgi:hypothetical protein
MRTFLRRSLLLLPPLSGLLVFLACGSRTGLLVPGDIDVLPGKDAEADRIARDATEEPDADASIDVIEPEDAEDAGDAPIDVVFRDVPVIDECPDAGATLIYVLSSQNNLYSFYPPTLAFTSIGMIACPDPNSQATPFSMAVDRRGIAYSVFTDGNLFRVDTASAACEPTTFTPDQDNFDTFGMGFVANTGDAGETLFVDQAGFSNTGENLPSAGLASINVTSYQLTFVASFSSSNVLGAELTGTGTGQLYAFYTNGPPPDGTGTGSNIIEVDKNTGDILNTYPLQVGSPNDGYAFAYWGGVFWVFTSTPGFTQVTRYDPIAKLETPVTTLQDMIVGAGVSTCAPQ